MGEGAPRPGGEVPHWQLFEPRVDQATMRQMGVNTPERQFFPFNKGETLSFDKSGEGEEREPMIVDADGNKIPFEQWASQQQSNQ